MRFSEEAEARARTQLAFNHRTARLSRERDAMDAQIKDAAGRRAVAELAEKALRDGFSAQPDVLPMAANAIDYRTIAEVVATLIDQQAGRS